MWLLLTIGLDLRFNKWKWEQIRQDSFFVQILPVPYFFLKVVQCIHDLVSATPMRLFTRLDPKLTKMILKDSIFINYRSYSFKNFLTEFPPHLFSPQKRQLFENWTVSVLAYISWTTLKMHHIVSNLGCKTTCKGILWLF